MPDLPPSGSALFFDARHPEIQAFARERGWLTPERKLTVYTAELVFTADGWKTTLRAPLTWLSRERQGFATGLPPGTPIEFAVHAQVGVSRDNFYSFDDRAELWVNGGGQNLRGTTEVLGPA